MTGSNAKVQRIKQYHESETRENRRLFVGCKEDSTFGLKAKGVRDENG